MPRPKVRPENRQRAAIACEPCKTAKIKCDSTLPCGACRRRKRTDDCVFTTDGRRHARALSDYLPRPAATTPSPESTSTPLNVVESRSKTVGASNSTDGEDCHTPKSRMLLSSKFEKLFVGEAASLSYLQFLRRIVKRSIGECLFTEGEFSAFMLESSSMWQVEDVVNGVTLSGKEVFVKSFLEATTGILDLCAEADLLAALQGDDLTIASIGEASMVLVLAIGAQCRGEPGDLQLSHSFLALGRQLAFQDMLSDPSVEMVRSFLLMAFYMLGACHRNAAFMYLGVAAKAASALGLHKAEQYRDLPVEECRARCGPNILVVRDGPKGMLTADRYKAWQSLRVLDAIVNSILARDGGLGTMQHDAALKQVSIQLNEDNSAQSVALSATFEACGFIDEIEIKWKTGDTASTEDFLRRLRKWSQSLPPELRTVPEYVSPGSQSTWSIGNLHVACVYYFTVILATRRYFTNAIIDSMRSRSPSASCEATGTRLADVCLDAARKLAGVTHKALASQQLMRNMCLVKAWIFAAGLLLGFALFADRNEAGVDVQQSFEHCIAVLEYLAEQSAQAAHYHSILAAFSDAITMRRQKLLYQRRQTTDKYLDDFSAAQPQMWSPSAQLSPSDGSPLATRSGGMASDSIDLDMYQLGDAEVDWTEGLAELSSQAFPTSFDTFAFDYT